MSNRTTISIDLAKNIVPVGVFNKAGKLQVNKVVSAKKLFHFVSRYPTANIFMAACGSAHYWGRRFQEAGHKVGLIPPHIAAKGL